MMTPSIIQNVPAFWNINSYPKVNDAVVVLSSFMRNKVSHVRAVVFSQDEQSWKTVA